MNNEKNGIEDLKNNFERSFMGYESRTRWLTVRENQRMVSDGILFSWINIQVAFLLRMTHIL